MYSLGLPAYAMYFYALFLVSSDAVAIWVDYVICFGLASCMIDLRGGRKLV